MSGSLLEKLDKEVEQYIDDTKTDNEDYIKLEDDLADLIIKNYQFLTERQMYKSRKYVKSLSLNKSIDLVREFLLTYYGDEYLNDFNEALDGIFEFEYGGDPNSYYNFLNNKIHISMLNTIDDPQTIVHEFMHYKNSHVDLDKMSDACDYFSEAISFYNEYLFEEFISLYHPNKLNELKIYRYERDEESYLSAIIIKILNQFILLKQNGHTLNKHFLGEVIDAISYLDEATITTAFDTIKLQLEESDYDTFEKLYISTVPYVVASVFGKYLYFEYKKSEHIGANMNEIINNYNVQDLYDFLNVATTEGTRYEAEDEYPILFDKGETKRLENIYTKRGVVS